MDKMLNEKTIKEKLDTIYIGKDFYFFEETSSTFDEAKKICLKNGSIICAKRQTNGRGRLGRSWQSENGGIYFSVILKPEMETAEVHIMTALCAVGIQRAIESLIPCYIKWPNDIVTGSGKKICGILTRLEANSENEKYINVGIGINANTKVFDDELKYASSIALAKDEDIDENELLCTCLKQIENICDAKDYTLIMEEYKSKCINLGKRVRILYAHEDKSETGECIDISKDGCLVIKKDDGTYANVNSGEVSVRGIYGEDYV